MSVFMTVVEIAADGVSSAGAAIVASQSGGSLTVALAQTPQADAANGAQSVQTDEGKTPEDIKQRIQFSMTDGSGQNIPFAVGLTQDGVVIRAESELGRKLMKAQRDVVIAVALSEVRKQLQTPLDNLGTVYMDFSQSNQLGL
jgi:hypothetical protein